MNIEQKNEPIYRVQSVDRVLDILECFSFQDREMNLTEIVRRTGLNITTAKRLISNLKERGYLQQDPDSKRYQLGLRLFELGGIVYSSFNLRRAASHVMTRLQEETGATVLLGIRLDDQLVYVDKREGQGMIRITSDIGWRRPLHYGMLGMVLLAYLQPREIRSILKKSPLESHTPFSITDDDAFSLRLEQIRKQGYITEKEEAVEGVIGIAAPIRDFSRRVIAALGMAFPKGQRSLQDNADRFTASLKQSCDEISSDLGYLKI